MIGKRLNVIEIEIWDDLLYMKFNIIQQMFLEKTVKCCYPKY